MAEKQQLRTIPPDNSHMLLADRILHYISTKTAKRRKVFKAIGKGAVIGTAVTAATIPVIDTIMNAEYQAEVDRPEPKIKWVDGQEERLATATSMVLCFAGAGIGTAVKAAEALTPELQHLGAVGYVEYSTHGLKMDEIAEKILEIKRQHPNIQQFSVWGQSEGPLVVGGVLEAMNARREYLPLEYVFMDCPVRDTSYLTDAGAVALVTKFNDVVRGSAILATAENIAIRHDNPYTDPESVSPALFKEQLDIMRDGTRYLQWIAKAAENYKTRIVRIRPADEKKDPFVDEERSDAGIKEILPTVRNYTVEGNQDHANPNNNLVEYLKVIKKAREELGRR